MRQILGRVDIAVEEGDQRLIVRHDGDIYYLTSKELFTNTGASEQMSDLLFGYVLGWVASHLQQVGN